MSEALSCIGVGILISAGGLGVLCWAADLPPTEAAGTVGLGILTLAAARLARRRG